MWPTSHVSQWLSIYTFSGLSQHSFTTMLFHWKQLHVTFKQHEKPALCTYENIVQVSCVYSYKLPCDNVSGGDARSLKSPDCAKNVCCLVSLPHSPQRCPVCPELDTRWLLFFHLLKPVIQRIFGLKTCLGRIFNSQ